MSARVQVKIIPRFSDSILIGPDEGTSDRVITDLSFSTELPGGFGPADFSFGVPDGVTPNKTWLYCPVELRDADTDALYYRGRIVGITVDNNTASIECEGWSKHLSDNEFVREIFIDRDLSGFTEASAGRKLSILQAAYTEGGSFQATSRTAGMPCIEINLSGQQVQESWHVACEAWYNSNGIPLSKISFSFESTGDRASGLNNVAYLLSEDGYGITKFTSSKNFLWTTYEEGAEYTVTKTGPNITGAVAPRYYVMLSGTWTGTGTGILVDACWYRQVAIFGDHGITVRGTFPNYGLYASDIAKYLVDKYAPLLEYTTGREGTVETTSALVTQSAYKEQASTTTTSILETISVLGGPNARPIDWGVYEKFFFKEPEKYGRTWRVRRDEATEDQDQGPDASERLNGVVVLFNRGDGVMQSYGPINSGATYESEDLEDNNPSNPANNDGAKHWKVVDAGIMLDVQAKLVGGLVLAQGNRTDWRGSVVCIDTVRDENGVEWPVEMMRAGDRVIVEDDPEGDVRPRRIVNTDFNESENKNVCSIGAPPDYLSVLLARAQLKLESVGISG